METSRLHMHRQIYSMVRFEMKPKVRGLSTLMFIITPISDILANL